MGSLRTVQSHPRTFARACRHDLADKAILSQRSSCQDRITSLRAWSTFTTVCNPLLLPLNAHRCINPLPHPHHPRVKPAASLTLPHPQVALNLYCLYYLRGIDECAFLIRMIMEICKVVSVGLGFSFSASSLPPSLLTLSSSSLSPTPFPLLAIPSVLVSVPTYLRCQQHILTRQPGCSHSDGDRRLQSMLTAGVGG